MQLTSSRPPTRIDGIGPEVLAPLLGLPHLVIPCELLLEHLGVISPIVVLPL